MTPKRSFLLGIILLATLLSFGAPAFAQAGGSGFFVMSTALGLQGQPGWAFYNGADAPDGAYMAWLLQGQSLTGTVQLPQQLTPGRYFVFFYGNTYDSNETMQASTGGVTSAAVLLNPTRNQFWSDRAALDRSEEN